jgi:protein phosphatase
MLQIDAFGLSDIGAVRRNNEDAWVIAPDLSLALVADGMGGAASGEIASAMTIEAVMGYLRQPAEDLPPEQRLKEAIREANRRVRERAESDADCAGMGSTVVAAHWLPPQVVIANVGDSRAYLYRGGELTQLSYDQTVANELQRGLGLTAEQLRSYPHRNVLTMAIGSSDNVLILTREETLQQGDRLLLCTDGLTGAVADAAIAEALAADRPLRETAEELVEQAKAGGSEDNITVVLLHCTDE